MKKLLLSISFGLCFVVFAMNASSQNWQRLNDSKSSIETKVGMLTPEGSEISIEFEFNAYALKSLQTGKGNASLLQIPDCFQSQLKGEPSLPLFTRSVVVPNNVDLKVNIAKSKYVEFEGIDIVPSKGVISRDKNPDDIPYEYGSVYSVNEFYPANIAQTSEPYIIRNVRGQDVTVYPVQYNPVTKKVRVYTSMVVELVESGKKAANVLSQNAVIGNDNVFESVLSNHFMNYKGASSNSKLSESGKKMLIVCYSSFISAMEEFKSWKESIGYTVDLVNYSSIGSASALKTYVQNAYNTKGISYLLLVGDHAQVPASSTSAGYSDNNYGYTAGNDHYLDLFVGRFSAENTTQLQTQIDRTIYYERNISSSETWFKKGVGIASNEGGSGGDNGETDEVHMNNIEKILKPYGYSIDRVYQNGGSASQLSSLLNSGRGIINYVGHGSNTSWASMTYSQSNVNSLTNENKLPFVISVACVNGNFTGTTCFAETWLRATNNGKPTGAIAFCGSTINQSWASPMCAQDKMNALLVSNSYITYGGMFVNGMYQMISVYGTDGANMADTWVLFGDPSVQMRTPGHPNGPSSQVNNPPIANFTASSQTITQGNIVTFTSTSTNNPTSYSWVFEGGTPSTSTSSNPTVTYNSIGNFDVKLTVSNASGSNSETKANFITVTEYVADYCTSAGSNYSYEWIAGVKVGAFTNTSSSAGYTNFTSKTISVSAGSDYAITLTPGHASSAYAEYWKIWIDLNGDADFDDPGELVFDAGAASKTAVNGTITIPAGTVPKTTRMRVSMKYNGAQTACETFGYGEVEDYTVVIAGSTSDTQPPTTPTGFAYSNLTETSVSLSWNASTDNVGVTGYDVYMNGSLKGTVTQTSASITGLTENTSYSFYVKAKDAAGNTSYSSSTLSLTTLGGSTPSYCQSKGSNSSYEWIAKVQVGTYSNASGSAGYTDFTSEEVPLTPGSSANIVLTPGYASSAYAEYWKVWIDFNNDNQFSADELVFDAGSTSKTAVNGTINVPANASGSTRMRVSMKYNAASTACETFGYGEVEDYTVVIAGSTSDTQAPTTPTGLTASSITSSSAQLSWNASTDNVGVTGYDVYMGGTLQGTVATNSANVTGLSAGTSYSFYVKAKDAAGNTSGANNTYSLTTTGGTLTYCTSKGATSYEWIDLVELNQISNTTAANGGYGNFTNLTATVARGASQTIFFSAGFKGSSYTEYWHVWIDWNQNGIFDANERMVYGSSSSAARLSSSFTVPSNALLGTTRMRVTMKYNAAATACETFGYGEVEDYTINVVETSTYARNDKQSEILDFEEPTSVTLYPVPASNFITVSASNGVLLGNISIYSVTGSLVKVISSEHNSQRIDISDIPSGVYIISVENEREKFIEKFIKK